MMKAYKKSALLLGLAMLSGESLAEISEIPLVEISEISRYLGAIGSKSQQSREEVLNEFIDAYTRFSSDPGNWILTLDDVNRYVEENAKDNKKLIKAAFLVQGKGKSLSLGIKFGYNISDLLKDAEELQEQAKILDDVTFWWIDKEKKKNAREVLLVVITSLLNITRKAIFDSIKGGLILTPELTKKIYDVFPELRLREIYPEKVFQ